MTLASKHLFLDRIRQGQCPKGQCTWLGFPRQRFKSRGKMMFKGATDKELASPDEDERTAFEVATGVDTIFFQSHAQTLLHFNADHHRIGAGIRKTRQCPDERNPRSRGSSDELFAVFARTRQTKRPAPRFSGQEKHLHGMVCVLHRLATSLPEWYSSPSSRSRTRTKRYRRRPDFCLSQR